MIHDRRLVALITGLVALTFVALVCFIQLDHTPNYDEFYHLIPAVNWLNSGELVILDGTYDRGSLFTKLVALSMNWFGTSFEVARLPSALAGWLTASCLFWWVYRNSTVLAALIAVLVYTLLPEFTYSVGQTRFYSVHGLFILLIAICLYQSEASPKISPAYLFRLAIALILFILAYGLQSSTLVAALGFSLWLALDYRHLVVQRSRLIQVSLALFIAVLAVTAYYLGLLNFVLQNLTYNALWAAEQAGNPTYYLLKLGESLGVLLGLLPLVLLLTWQQINQRFLLFCGLVFAVGFIIQSVAAQKSGRYILFLLPFLCALLAVCLERGLKQLYCAVEKQATASKLYLAIPELIRPAALSGLIVVSLLSVIVLVPSMRETVKQAVIPAKNSTLSDWERANNELNRLASDRIVVTSEGIKAAYFLGDFDYELNLSVVLETDTHQEFGRDYRTGRYVVGTLDSLRRIMACHTRGLAIIDDKRWRSPHGVTMEVSDYIEQNMEQIELPKGSFLRAYTWQGSQTTDDRCPPKLSR